MKKLLLLAALLIQPLTAATSLTFSGQGYITQGGEYYYNTTNSNVGLSIINVGSPTDDIAFYFTAPDYSHFWTVCFRAPDGQRLQVGRYDNAFRWHTGDRNNPTFDIFGDGRGSNYVEGWFEVLEIEWNPEHTNLVKFAAAFHHISEGIESRYTDGTILYNTVPEVSSLGLVLLSIPAFLRRSRR